MPINFKNSEEQQKQADGIERAVLLVSDSMDKIQEVVEKVFEGRPLSPGKKYKNPLDRGLVPIVREVSEIDLCNVLSYVVNKVPNVVKNIPQSAQKKDGSNPKADSATEESRPKTQFETFLSSIQDGAYDAQKIIDSYFSEFGDSKDINAKNALFLTCQQLQVVVDAQIQKKLQQVLQSDDENIKKIVKLAVLQTLLQFLFDSVQSFGRYTNFTIISNKKYEKIKSTVSKIRGVLITIQIINPNNPAFLLSSGLSFLPAKVQEDLNKINKIVKPEKLLPFVKNIQKACVNVQNQANFLLSIIRRLQTLVKRLITGLTLFKRVRQIILAILSPVPNAFTTVGLNIIIQDTTTTKLDKLIDNLLKRLRQLNVILTRSLSIVAYTISQIDEVLVYLKIIILNLESCDNADPEIVKDLKKTVEDLENTSKILKNFKDNYEKNKNDKKLTFGDRNNSYFIKIITEQLTDEGISLKRRYGVALNMANILVASSTPTFASDDRIIIEEVKALLVSKKLVNPSSVSVDSQELVAINESTNFLEDNEISIEESNLSDKFDISLQGDTLDDPNNEDENKGIGLNAYINKSQGGKKLRERVRKKIASIISKFGFNLPSFNVGGGQEDSKRSNESKKAKIEELQKKKEDLEKQRRQALLTGPAGFAVVAAKTKQIKDVDKQIAELKK